MTKTQTAVNETIDHYAMWFDDANEMLKVREPQMSKAERETLARSMADYALMGRDLRIAIHGA